MTIYIMSSSIYLFRKKIYKYPPLVKKYCFRACRKQLHFLLAMNLWTGFNETISLSSIRDTTTRNRTSEYIHKFSFILHEPLFW